MLDLGRRARHDQGTLGVIAARLASTGRAVGLLRRAQYRSVTRCTAPGEVIIQADTPTVPVGIDGEAVTVRTPVHCTIRPPRAAGPAAADPARCPRHRGPRIDWARLWRIAFGRSAPASRDPLSWCAVVDHRGSSVAPGGDGRASVACAGA